MKIILLAIIALVGFSVGRAETIMDQMGMVFDQSYLVGSGNAIGGENLFGGRFAVQRADGFRTTSTGYIITEVQVGNLAFTPVGFSDARISIFPEADGRPLDEPIFTARASELELEVVNIPFKDGVYGLFGIRSIVSGLEVSLDPETRYYIDVQVYSGPDNWAGTVRARTFTGTDSFVRDGPSDEGEGVFGTTTWITGEEAGLGAGDSAYRIEATSGFPCTGGESIAKARCANRNGSDRLRVVLTDATPGDTYTVTLSTGETKSGTINVLGMGKARFKRLPSGDALAAAQWGCGATAQKPYACP